MKTPGNCRQIIAALKLYASDHQDRYPDADASAPKTSNQVFRILIREGYLEDERCFGARGSKFNPDNIIGDAPKLPEALEAGENHWAMTKGLSDSSAALTPLVFENPTSATWPPTWNVDAAGRKERGRAWRGGKIIIGLNDSSVMPIRLAASKGTNVGPKYEADGKNAFTRAGMNFEVLDIEE